MPPFRGRRRKGRKRPVTAAPKVKPTFWGKVATVAKDAIKGGEEIMRYTLPLLTYTLAPNKILDATGPDYVCDNSWSIRLLNEGIAQGSSQDERRGNKIKIKGVQVRGMVENTITDHSTVRIMLVRMQKNIFEQSNVNSPFPDSVHGFPRYRDVQILHDQTFTLGPSTGDEKQQHFKIYRMLNQITNYQDDLFNVPGKGTLYFCGTCDQASVSMVWNAQVTFGEIA